MQTVTSGCKGAETRRDPPEAGRMVLSASEHRACGAATVGAGPCPGEGSFERAHGW